jgi:hypothetical protein
MILSTSARRSRTARALKRTQGSFLWSNQARTVAGFKPSSDAASDTRSKPPTGSVMFPLCRILNPSKTLIDDNRVQAYINGMKRRLSQSTSNTLGAQNTAKALQRPHTRTFATIMEEGHKPIRLRLRHPDDHLVFLVNLVNSVPPEQRGADVPFYTVADEIRVFRDMLRLLLNPQNRVLLKGLALADFSKLRRCAACSNFFVRSRKDQMCCCKKCSNVYRVRRWREKYQDHYKIQRDGRAQSMEKEKPQALPARQGKDVVVSFSVRRKNRSRKRPKSEQDHSAGSRKAKAPPARGILESDHPASPAAHVREGLR